MTAPVLCRLPGCLGRIWRLELAPFCREHAIAAGLDSEPPSSAMGVPSQSASPLPLQSASAVPPSPNGRSAHWTAPRSSNHRKTGPRRRKRPQLVKRTRQRTRHYPAAPLLFRFFFVTRRLGGYGSVRAAIAMTRAADAKIGRTEACRLIAKSLELRCEPSSRIPEALPWDRRAVLLCYEAIESAERRGSVDRACRAARALGARFEDRLGHGWIAAFRARRQRHAQELSERISRTRL